jgi:ubiquinone/menaquinone biosynthesis C-methylase UbiE
VVKQSDIFRDGEAEEWLARNYNQLHNKEDDPVIDAIINAKIKPTTALEVGCSNGWRVKLMKRKLACDAYGIDPMFKTKLWNCSYGTADDLSRFASERFDLLVYGWCLYLCDREDLFKIVCEGDRVLQDGGFLIVYDFHVARPYKKKYKHKTGVFSFKMDHAQLWLANPNYRLVSRQLFENGDNRTSITIIRKSISEGWPLYD